MSRPEPPYMPHPAPPRTTENSESAMATTGSLITTLLIPAIISLSLYLLLSYAIIPLWQRYRGRYSRYIPLDTISSGSRTLTQRFQESVTSFLLPSTWRTQFQSGRYDSSAQDGSESGFDEDEGEELFEVDDNRREAISLDASRGREDGGRLSRDLEEGFRDDSEDEELNSNNNRTIQQAR